MPFLKTLFACLLIAALLSACAAPQAAAALTDSPCQAPCWQNITPFVTTEDQVADLLRQIPNIDPATVEELRPWNRYDKRFVAQFLDDRSKVYVYIIDQYVESVLVTDETGLTVEEVITMYGEPSFLVADRFYSQVSVLLFFPKKGVGIVYSNSDLYSIIVKPEGKVEQILFTQPENLVKTYYPEETLEELREKGRAFDWPGYQEIPFNPKY